MAEEENPLYRGLGYYESLESKKNLLSAEMLLLTMMKTIRRYNSLRQEELRIKSQIFSAINELDSALKKTKASFPFLKIPQKAKREELQKREEFPSKMMQEEKEEYDPDLEFQLRDIQNKLRMIGR
ncbi:hypothetical protein M0R19_00525 [Candidatus Pacearchaeota archaeon]|nr:hypothetical protein [Candidatus Pacearchaeota archaeon]